MKRENLIEITPFIYNDLFSNRNNYNKEHKNNKQIFPKINPKSFSSQNKIISKINNKLNEIGNYGMKDKTFKYNTKKALTNTNFFRNNKIQNSKIRNYLRKDNQKKTNYLSIKNIELEENKDIISKRNTSLYIYNSKKLNKTNYIQKKKNNVKNIINDFIKKINNDKSYLINNENKQKENHDTVLHNNSYKKNKINEKKYKTMNNFNLKFNKADNFNKNNYNLTNQLRNKSKISNLFLKLLSNNIFHKVELNNQTNQQISLEIVKNLLNEEINILNNKKNIFNINKNIDFHKDRNNIKSNYIKKNVLPLNQNNLYKKINNIISVIYDNYDNIETESDMKAKKILSKFKTFDLNSDIRMFDDKNLLKNEQLEKLYIEDKKELLNDKKLIKEINNFFHINSKDNKSRNFENKLFPYNTENEDKTSDGNNNNNTTEKCIQKEYNENDGCSKEKIKNLMNAIIFQVSYELNNNLKKYKNSNNSNNSNNLMLDEKKRLSISEILQNLNIKTNKTKKIRKFKINRQNIKYLTKKEVINEDKKEKIILKKYLSSNLENHSQTEPKNIFQSKDNDSTIEHISPLKKIFHSSKKGEHIQLKPHNYSQFKNKHKEIKYKLDFENITDNKTKEYQNINYKKNNRKEVKKDNNISHSTKTFKRIRNFIIKKVNTKNNKNIITNENIKREEPTKEEKTEYINKYKYKDKDKYLDNQNNSFSSYSSLNKYYESFEEEILNKKNEEEEIEQIKSKEYNITNNNNKEIKIDTNNINNKKYNEENSVKTGVVDAKDFYNIIPEEKIKSKYYSTYKKEIEIKNNNLFKKKFIENIQHNNLKKSNKKNKKANNKFLNGKNNIKKIDKNENKKDLNESNNNYARNKSKSIGNLTEIIFFNKISSQTEKNEDNKEDNQTFENKKEQKNNFFIRKEVLDILNNYNNNNSNDNSKEIENNSFKQDLRFKRKYRPRLPENLMKIKKKKFQKKRRETMKNIYEIKKLFEMQNNENDNNIKTQEELDREIKEKILEKKMYQFFKKIQNLKNTKNKNYEEELNAFIDAEIDKISDIKSKDWENRINGFYRKFEKKKKKLYFFKKFKKRDLIFTSPIKFSSNSIDKNNKVLFCLTK